MDDFPKILGKFNFITVKPDLYDILFIPFIGAGAVIIAKNLSYDLMIKMREDLNAVFFNYRDDIRKEASEMEGE